MPMTSIDLEDRDKVRHYAFVRGMSLKQYINGLIKKDMEEID